MAGELADFYAFLKIVGIILTVAGIIFFNGVNNQAWQDFGCENDYSLQGEICIKNDQAILVTIDNGRVYEVATIPIQSNTCELNEVDM